MRLYAGSSQQFIDDTALNQIADKLKAAFFAQMGYNPSQSEITSWRNSLKSLAMAIQYAGLLDHGILLEYQLPMNSRRLDCLICGRDEAGKPAGVIIELKQWERCEPSEGENEVTTFVGGALRDVLHPSAQVGGYQMYLADTHTAFYEGPDPVFLSACSYLHNYAYDAGDPLFAPKFEKLLQQYPVFTMDHVPQLRDYLSAQLRGGDGLAVLSRVEQSTYRPSRKLMQHVADVIEGNPAYVLLDEQQVVFDMVLANARDGYHHRRKHVMIVRGGPGTGKSVIAINLMAKLLRDDYNAHYATGSRAFTQTLRKIIGRRGEVQFKYFNSYMTAEPNEVDVLIADEAHRIRKTSHNRFTPRAQRTDRPQIEELIQASKVAVFFIDDKQVVRPNEIGSADYLKKAAEAAGCTVSEFELEAQFRCSGSDAFVNWVNNTLGIQRTANVLWNGDEAFDVKIFDSPESLEAAIRRKAQEGHSARMTAGFCWPWSKQPKPDGTLEADVVVGDYRRPWNARPNATKLAKGIPKADLWAYDPGGMDQVGCIYTAQGFEFDYVGVIVGKDLVYDFDAQTWVGHKAESHDTVVKRSGEQFLDLVKNTYRVLLTRGLKGCYVYFMDKETERFVKSRMESSL